MWAQVINIVLGLAVMALPGMLGFSKAESNNHYIVGPLVAAFALVATTGVGRSARLFNIPAGSWLMVGPLLLGFSTTARLTGILLGMLIVVFSLFKGTLSQRFGGGWRSLWQKEPAHWKIAQQIKQEKNN